MPSTDISDLEIRNPAEMQMEQEFQNKCDELLNHLTWRISRKSIDELQEALLKKIYPDIYKVPSPIPVPTYAHMYTALSAIKIELEKQEEFIAKKESNMAIISLGSSTDIVVPFSEGLALMATLEKAESARNAASYERERLTIKALNEKYFSMSIISYETYLVAKARHILLGGEN